MRIMSKCLNCCYWRSYADEINEKKTPKKMGDIHQQLVVQQQHSINGMNQKEGWFLISILDSVNRNVYFKVQFKKNGAT